MNRKLILAALFGNILEWYDFLLYASLAALFAPLFFPSANPLNSLLASFGAFAAGFIVRPVGAVLLGNIGDKIGRRYALLLSIALMAIPTFLIGCLPTYQSIGILAPVFLILLRLVQGISAAGELPGTMLLLTEHAPIEWRARMGSLVIMGVCLGLLLASLVVIVMTKTLTHVAMQTWGWRIPFLLGIVIGIAGYYLRVTTKLDVQLATLAKSPWRETLACYKNAILKVFFIQFIPAAGFNTILIFMTTLLVHFLNYPMKLAVIIYFFAVILFVIVMMISATISDHIGRKPVLIAAAIGILILSYPCYYLLQNGSAAVTLIAISVLVSLLGIYYGPATATIVEIFPTSLRYTPLALGHSLAFAILGGTSPLLASFLIHRFHSISAPSFYLIFAALISLLTVLQLPETYRKVLSKQMK